jgi:ABC-2 type transport system permease protein
MRLLGGEIRKLLRRPASLVTLGIQLAIIVVVYLAISASFRAGGAGGGDPQARAGIQLLLTFPSAYAGALGLVTGLGGLLAVAFGAAAAGGDWGWGMVKVAVARGESRARYILAKLVAVEVMIAIGLLLAFAAAVAAAFVAATAAGISTSGIGDSTALGNAPEQLARGYLGMAEQGAIGFAIATVARSQLAGLGAGIALYFVEQFSTIFLSDIVKYFPFHVAQSALRIVVAGGAGGGGTGSLTRALDPDLSLLLVAAYLALAAIIAIVFVERAEISG